MKSSPRLRRFLALAGSSLLAVCETSADTIYWDGTSASWNTAANWTTAAGAATPNPLAVPGASDDAIFNRTGQNGNINIALDADQAALSLTFSSAGTTTIRGNTSGTTARGLTIGSGGITKNADSGTASFGGNVGVVNIALSANQIWTNNSTTALNIGTGYVSSATDANVDLGANQLTIAGTGNISLGVVNQAEAVLTGTGALIKNGTGVLSIGGNNTGYSGNVTINQGVLYYGDRPGALGTGNLLITGGAIEGRWNNAFTRAQGTGAGEIQITGGVSGLGGGNNMTYNIGAITWGSATFNPTEFILQTSNANTTGKSTLSSSINLNGTDRTIRSDQAGGDLANGYGTFSGNITGTGAGLIKTGIGHHILTGTNTYDGGTTINQGSLLFGKTAAMPASGNVQVNDGGILGIRVGGAGNWTNGTSGVGTIGGLLAGLGGQTGSTVGYSGNVGVQLDVTATTTYSGDIANVGTSLALYKTGGSTLTLNGNNTYSGGTIINQGTLIADSATALGGGNITFKGGTLQYTANSAATDFGSQIANSTSAITLNTNSQNVTLSDIAVGNTGGLTKSGAGTLTLSGTNTYTGTTAISAGAFVVDGGTTSIGDLTLASNTSLSVINGGTLNTVGVIGDEGLSNLTWSVIGGGATSTWNIGGSNFYLFGYNPPKSNNVMTIDGAGVAASAVLTNIQDLQWGRSTFDSDLLVTNGGVLNVNRDAQLGSTYYGETGINNTITIQGGTADSIMTVGRDFYVGYGDRAAASSNTTTVGAGGQLTVTQHMYVGHVSATANSDNPSTNNKLVVTGGGTASMNQLSLGYAVANDRDAGANIVEVTSGGELSTIGTAYIGRANNSGTTSNANTLTVTGTGSSWDAGNQTVYVGHTNNASAASNNNILTIGTGGSLTNVSNLIVGFGTGTETGNQLVLNGGSISATTVTVNASNSLEIGANGGSLIGSVVNNGALNIGSNVPISLAGNISGSGGITQTGTGITSLSGTNSYNGGTTVSGGTLTFLNTNAKPASGTHAFDAGTTLGLGVSGASAFTSSDVTNAFAGTMTGNLTGITVTSTTHVGIDTSNGNFTYSDDITGSPSKGLTKLGANALNLTGAHTYNGATNVNAGTLEISGSGSINPTSAINVAAGASFVYNSSTALTVAPTLNGSGSNKATFSGSGTINAAMTLNSIDDVLSPGNSPGIQSFGTDQTWSSFSYDWELNDWAASVTGVNIDQIQISGTLDLDGAAYALNILSLDSLNAAGLVGAGGGNPFAEVSNSWTILTTSGGISNFNALEWTINAGGFLDSESGNWELNQVGNNLVLNYTAIPEPGAALLGSLGLLLIFRRRR